MPYILPHTFIDKIQTLQSEYEHIKQIKLSNADSPYSLSRFFGATDVDKRRCQFDFIARMHKLFQPMLLEKIEDAKTERQWQAHILSLRILLVGCLYIQAQISQSYSLRAPKSLMSVLINNALGISSANPLDEESKRCCFYAAKLWIKSLAPLKNDKLFTNKMTALEYEQFTSFRAFVEEQCYALELGQISGYPMTRLMRPLFAKPFEIAGSTAGFMIGEVIASNSQTGSLMALSLISSGIIGSVPAAQLGVVILVPAVTKKILSSIYGASLSVLLGQCMRAVGDGTGYSLGMSLDLSLTLLSRTLSWLNPTAWDNTNMALISGLQLTDGKLMMSAMDIEEGYVALRIEDLHANRHLNVNVGVSSLTIEEVDEEEEHQFTSQ